MVTQKNLLIVGSNASHALETYYQKHLIALGLPTSIFNSYDYYTKTVISRIRHRLGDMSIYKEINKQIIKQVNEQKPDYIWVFKGMEFTTETIYQLSKLSIPLINYNPDHPFIRTYASSGGKHIAQSVPLYNMHYCYSRNLCNTIIQDYKINAEWLPFGYHITQQEYDQVENSSIVPKICFLGNPDMYRAKAVKKIADAGFKIDVYGYKWSKYIASHKNIKIHELVFGLNFWNVLRKYAVQLNVFRPHNIDSHNMRTFEIPAAGGIQLAPYSSEHLHFFKEKEEIFLYQNDEQMLQQIEYIMQLTVVQQQAIRAAARNRSLLSAYSYEHRATQVYHSLVNIA